MDVRITEGYDLRAILEGATRPGVWAGDGAAALGLTGEVALQDWERLSELVSDEDEDQDEADVSPYQAKTAEGAAILERLRRDGLL
jgi:hypothetical protein